MLYLHIPFCLQRCIYCDFYSTTQGDESRNRFVDALCREIAARKRELPSSLLSSVYFGGGTPSQLTVAEVARIFDAIHASFDLAPDAELTFEANPDDITPAYVKALRELGINRMSLGVQSFNDSQLRMLRRRHDARQALEAVSVIREAGIDNISIDLIYGLPKQSLDDFNADLRQALQLPIRHLSAYSLTYEEGTALYRLREQGKVREAKEGLSAAMYEALLDATASAGMEHYEISNFAFPGYAARHNSGYWQQRPYLGCGPGAHSFDGNRRRFNRSSLNDYLAAPGCPPHEREELSPEEQFNEMIFTSLRTSKGLDLEALERRFGTSRRRYTETAARRSLVAGHLTLTGNRLRLTRAGLFVSDDVMSDLMLVD